MSALAIPSVRDRGGDDGPTGSGKAAPHAGISLARMQKPGADAALPGGPRQPAQAAPVPLRLLSPDRAVAARAGNPAGARGTGTPGGRAPAAGADAGGARPRPTR